MPKSADEQVEDTWLQSDEELGTKVKVSEEANINQVLKPKNKPPTKQTEVKEQQSESYDEHNDDKNKEKETK